MFDSDGDRFRIKLFGGEAKNNIEQTHGHGSRVLVDSWSRRLFCRHRTVWGHQGQGQSRLDWQVERSAAPRWGPARQVCWARFFRPAACGSCRCRGNMQAFIMLCGLGQIFLPWPCMMVADTVARSTEQGAAPRPNSATYSTGTVPALLPSCRGDSRRHLGAFHDLDDPPPSPNHDQFAQARPHAPNSVIYA